MNSALSLAVWWEKLEKNDKVRQNMTQIASLLVVVATVFIGLWTLFTVKEGGALICETKLPMQELELTMQGGVIAEFYGSYSIHDINWVHEIHDRLQYHVTDLLVDLCS